MNVSLSPFYDSGLWPKQEIPIDIVTIDETTHQPMPWPLPDNNGDDVPVPDEDEPPPLEEVVPPTEAS